MTSGEPEGVIANLFSFLYKWVLDERTKHVSAARQVKVEKLC